MVSIQMYKLMLFIFKTSYWTVGLKGIHLATVEQEREFFWAKVQVQQTFVDPSTRNHPSPVPFVFCVLTWTSQRLHSPLKCLVAHFSWFFFVKSNCCLPFFSPPLPILFLLFFQQFWGIQQFSINFSKQLPTCLLPLMFMGITDVFYSQIQWSVILPWDAQFLHLPSFFLLLKPIPIFASAFLICQIKSKIQFSAWTLLLNGVEYLLPVINLSYSVLVSRNTKFPIIMSLTHVMNCSK